MGGSWRQLAWANLQQQATAVSLTAHHARSLQEKLAALAGPQEEVYVRAQHLERALKEKAGQLSTAVKKVQKIG